MEQAVEQILSRQRFGSEVLEMSWRKIAVVILFSPILVGLFAFLAILVVWKMPMMCCQRWRRIRYLPVFGLAYYGLLVPLVAIAAGLVWWEIILLIGMIIIAGDWLLPDPFSFLLSPHKCRAIARAIEHLEAKDRIIYPMARVVGQEVGRTIVSVSINSDYIPPGRRFVAIGDNGKTVEELEFAYVSEKHGVKPIF
jgi:hypothetical protein